MRRNGFQRPLNGYQISSWIVFTGLTVGFYVFHFPFIKNDGMQIFVLVLYTVLACSVLLSGILCTKIDPADDNVRASEAAKRANAETPRFKTTEDGGQFFCSLCNVPVHKCSKHCRVCDKCVGSFDHHCRWLNNCIGKNNYRVFLYLVSLTLAQVTLQLCVGIYLVVRSYSDEKRIRADLRHAYGTNVSHPGLVAALCIYIFIVLAASLMLVELFVFHVVLLFKGLTTYDYIVLERERKLEAAKVAEAQAAQGTTEGLSPPTITVGSHRVLGIHVCGGEKVAPNPHALEGSNGAYPRMLKPHPKKPATSLKVKMSPCNLVKVDSEAARAAGMSSRQNTPKRAGAHWPTTGGEGLHKHGHHGGHPPGVQGEEVHEARQLTRSTSRLGWSSLGSPTGVAANQSGASPASTGTREGLLQENGDASVGVRGWSSVQMPKGSSQVAEGGRGEEEERGEGEEEKREEGGEKAPRPHR
eukprot:jgi/Mesvir1/29227/Mv18822-RA.1